MSCQDSEDEGRCALLFLFLKWPHLNISPTPALKYSCLCNWAPEDRCGSLGTLRHQALTFTLPVTITVTVLPASPRNRLSGFCARARLRLAFFTYNPLRSSRNEPQNERPLVENAANGRACYWPAQGASSEPHFRPGIAAPPPGSVP